MKQENTNNLLVAEDDALLFCVIIENADLQSMK